MVYRRGQQNAKMQYLRCLWTLPNDSKHNEASFSTILTDILYLRVAHKPRSPDPAIFVLTTDTTDHFTPCACARGNYNDDNDTTDYRANIRNFVLVDTVYMYLCSDCILSVVILISHMHTHTPHFAVDDAFSH